MSYDKIQYNLNKYLILTICALCLIVPPLKKSISLQGRGEHKLLKYGNIYI